MRRGVPKDSVVVRKTLGTMQVPKFGWMPSGADSGTSGILDFDQKVKDMVISVQLAVLLPVSSGDSSVDVVCFHVQLKGEEVFEQLAMPLASFVPFSSPRLQLLSACLLPSPWVPLPGLLIDLVYVLVGVIVSSDEFKGYVVCVFVQVWALMGLGCAAMMPVPPVVSSFPGVGAALFGPCPSGLGFAQSLDMRLCLCFQSFRSLFVAATLVFRLYHNNGLLTVPMDDVDKLFMSRWAFPGVGAALFGPCPSGLGFAQSPDMRHCLCFQSFRSFFVASTLVFGLYHNNGMLTVPVDDVDKMFTSSWALGFDELEPSRDKAAAAIAGTRILEKSKRALFFLKDDEETGEERKEKKEKEEGRERKEEEREERRVSASVLVPQKTMEQGSQSSDAQLEGNLVMGDMVTILVQKLDGRHLNVRVTQGVQVSVLCNELCVRLGISPSVFYLTRQGRVLHAYEELWLDQDERLCMRGRLRGGMEGDWTCQHCGRQGCWVTKVRCYRCGKSRYDPPAQQMDGNPNVPGWIRTQARQQTEREWAQATRGAGVGPGTSGQPLGSKTSPPPQQQNQRSQNQRQKTPAQSRAPSPGQEYQEYDALLAALHGLIPGSLLEQVRSSLPKPEIPLTERIMQVQNRLDEEKKAANSWKEAVKMREAALLEGRKTLADHMTKVEGLQAELSELETQFFTQRKEKEEQERKDESEKLAATQVDFEQVPIPEDVEMEDGRNGKKRRGVQAEPMTYEELEANILRSMDNNGKTPEDYAEMIQRVLAKKAQHRAECGESKVTRLDLQEDGNQEEDMNL